MKRLHVLYDAECALCQGCRRWLERQPAYVELRFIPFQAPEVPCRFPGIEKWNPSEELLVISDEGDVYRGPNAWIMCLYALRDYREWSQRLAAPMWLPWARRICELVSQNRLSISRLLATKNPATLERRTACANGRCGAPSDKRHEDPY
jgi:predicted DCC family thiol-disulfide oxidoreductase YuxK